MRQMRARPVSNASRYWSWSSSRLEILAKLPEAMQKCLAFFAGYSYIRQYY